MHSQSSEQESPLKKQPSKQQQALTFFSKLQMGDLCFMDIIKYGFALFGLTKAGKTTLAHLLVKNTLVGKEKENGQIYYKVNQDIMRLKEAKIGQTRQSETQIPNQCIFHVQSKDKSSLSVHILDCPGYEDSNGCNMLIANGYFHYRIFSKAQNIKFILTFDYNEMRGNCQRPKATMIEFFSSFKDYPKIKNQIMAATVFVFTKAERNQPFNEAQMNRNVISKLQGMRDCTGVDSVAQRDFIKELINNVIHNQKKKFFIFYKAVKDMTPLNNDDLLQKIHENTEFWSRKVINSDKQKTVDMNDIQMTLGKRVRMRAQFQLKFKKNFTDLMGTFEKRFKEAFLERINQAYSIQQITALFIKDSCLSPPQSCEFFNLICKFNSTFNLYDNQISLSPKYVQKRKIIQEKLLTYKCEEVEGKGIEWIQKLQISNLIILMIQKEEFTSAQESRTVSKFQIISHILLKIISQFKKIKFHKKRKDYDDQINKFSYIVYRLLQEAKTFKIIFSSDFEIVQGQETNTLSQWVDTTTIVYDFVQSLSDKVLNINDIPGNYIDFQQIKINYFINNSQIVKNNEQLAYYLEIQKYYKHCDQIQNKKLADKLAQLTTIKLKSNAKIDRNQTVCSLIQKIRIIKRKLILDNQYRQIQTYIQVINELGQELSKIDNNHQKKQYTDKQSCKFAIKFFKHSGNVYKVLNTFKLLLSKYNETENAADLKDILIEYGQYASTHGRKQLAIEAYQHADYLIDQSYLKKDQQDYLQKRQQERKRINRMIGLLGLQKRYDPSEAYYDDLMKNKHHTLVQDSLLELTQKTFPRNK